MWLTAARFVVRARTARPILIGVLMSVIVSASAPKAAAKAAAASRSAKLTEGTVPNVDQVDTLTFEAATFVPVADEVVADETAAVAARLKSTHGMVNKAVRTILGAARKADKLTLDTIYAPDGLMVNLEGFMAAGGKMTALAPIDRASGVKTPEYRLLSNVNSVRKAFGIAKPDRFDTWSTILAAVKVDKAILDGIEGDVITGVALAAAVKAAKPERESAAQDDNAAAGEALPVAIDDAPAGALFLALNELVARANEGKLSADEMSALAKSAQVVLAVVKARTVKAA
jgi:hypothetical protein